MSVFGPLPSAARDLLAEMLGRDHAGRELRVQAATALARPGCTCGCGTLELLVTDPGAPLSPVGEFPVGGEVTDEDGRPVAGLVLFVENGLLSSLEIFSYEDDGLPLPPLDRVTWHRDEPVG